MPSRWRSSAASEFQRRPSTSTSPESAVGQPFADFDGGGLAGAVGAQQAEALAAAHFEVEAVHGDHVFVRLAQIAELQGGRPAGSGMFRHYKSPRASNWRSL